MEANSYNHYARPIRQMGEHYRRVAWSYQSNIEDIVQHLW